MIVTGIFPSECSEVGILGEAAEKNEAADRAEKRQKMNARARAQAMA